MNSFSNSIKFKSDIGQIKYSNAFGHYQFKGKTSGLALKYVVRGMETYFIKNRLIKVPENHFVLVHPETDFEANTKRDCSETKGLCIDISLMFPKVDVDKILANDLLFSQAFGFSHSTSIGAQLSRVNPETEKEVMDILDKQYLLDIGNHLNTFSENIFRFKKDIYSNAKKESTQNNIIPKLLHGKEYIQENYRSNISLEEVAYHSNMSKFQFLKLFKECFHFTPQEMQSTLRMQEAKNLLKNGNLPLSKIAFDLGYFDLAAFSKKFKSSFGLSPSDFKNQQHFTND